MKDLLILGASITPLIISVIVLVYKYYDVLTICEIADEVRQLSIDSLETDIALEKLKELKNGKKT